MIKIIYFGARRVVNQMPADCAMLCCLKGRQLYRLGEGGLASERDGNTRMGWALFPCDAGVMQNARSKRTRGAFGEGFAIGIVAVSGRELWSHWNWCGAMCEYSGPKCSSQHCLCTEIDIFDIYWKMLNLINREITSLFDEETIETYLTKFFD